MQEGSGRAEAMDHDDGTTYDQLQVSVHKGHSTWRCVVHGVEVCRARCGGVSCTVWRCVVHGVEVCRARCGVDRVLLSGREVLCATFTSPGAGGGAG